MTAAGDDDLARQAALQQADLPGRGWIVTPVESRGEAADGDDALDACLVGFPHDDLVATTDSAHFARDAALAYSVVWVLTSDAAAGLAYGALAGDGFAECFTAAIAAEVDPEAGSAELLGHVGDRGAALVTGCASTLHRARLVGATPSGTVTVHLDLVVVHHGRVVTMVCLADAPRPFQEEDVAGVAASVANRLTSLATA